MTDKDQTIHDLLVIGGGASGLMAAISAARSGVRPMILERMDRMGKKLLATGNGRCNVTNLGAGLEHFHGADPSFAATALDRFGVRETLGFFESLGLLWKTEDEGRVFPRTDQASAVLDLLRHELRRLGIEESCDSEVVAIENKAGQFRVSLKNGGELLSRAVILASGGRAAPSLGSNGSGYKLARMLGHDVVEPIPALVQLRLDSPFPKRLKGLRVQAGIALNGRDSTSGEILFTEYGISGPAAIGLARKVHEIQFKRGLPVVTLDLFPDIPPEELRSKLDKRFGALNYKSAADVLVGMIHKRLILPILESARIDKEKSCGNLDEAEKGRLASILKAWRFEVAGTQSWNEAQVTAGGLATKDVDPETLESKIVPGLYFCGEVLDVDGDSGGYNLQWAWSSGFAAGTAAAFALNCTGVR